MTTNTITPNTDEMINIAYELKHGSPSELQRVRHLAASALGTMLDLIDMLESNDCDGAQRVAHLLLAASDKEAA